MEVEVKKAPPAYQQLVSSRLYKYKVDLASLRKEIGSSEIRENLYQQPLEDSFQVIHQRLCGIL